MIKRFQFGKPIETFAVMEKLEPCAADALPYFKQKNNSFSCALNESDIVYGLGENVRGINKRGWHYISNCADDDMHTETTASLYAAHNFFIVDGKERFGVFVDYAGKVEFDIDYSERGILSIKPDDMALDMYIVDGESCIDIVSQFRGLIGRSYIAPKWAFGCGQSRWGYKNERDILDVFEGYKKNGLPLDSIYMDIDYMEGFADFTIDNERFSDLEALQKRLKAEGVRLVPIIDAGIKIKEGDETYEQGKANGYFCKDENGNDFVGAVWPGLVHFPDVLNSKTREWFGGRYKTLIDKGIEGFWNDMNEPALFYTPEHLDAAIGELNEKRGKNMDMFEYLIAMDDVRRIMNDDRDKARMRHDADGETVCHDKAHNLYGGSMTRAAGEAFERLLPNKRMLLFARASCIGAHRYGGIWFGDNCSWWSHILMNLQMLPSVNMCGFLYSGADIGGFSGDATEDLLLRWTALGVFTPLMRNHSSMWSRMQEPYRFGSIEAFRRLYAIRYSLIPYLYSEYMKAALNDAMLFRPLAFDYADDERAAQVQDQLLLGEGLMIAPVYTQNASGRYVYLPEDMKLVVMRSPDDRREKVLTKGDHYIEVRLDEVPLFIRRGCLLPLAKAARCVDELNDKELDVLDFDANEDCEYVLYSDDGCTRDYDEPENYRIITKN